MYTAVWRRISTYEPDILGRPRQLLLFQHGFSPVPPVLPMLQLMLLLLLGVSGKV